MPEPIEPEPTDAEIMATVTESVKHPVKSKLLYLAYAVIALGAIQAQAPGLMAALHLDEKTVGYVTIGLGTVIAIVRRFYTFQKLGR